jgi:hypothetical protein
MTARFFRPVGAYRPRRGVADVCLSDARRMPGDTQVATGRSRSATHSLQEPGYSREPLSPAISIASRLWHALTPEPH